MVFVTTRVQLPELMDQPGLDPVQHRQALRGLSRVNRISGTAEKLWRRIRTVRPITPNEPLRVLDLACGGGDVLLDLAKRSIGHAIPIEFFGRDLSETAIAHAREAAQQLGLTTVDFLQADAFGGDRVNESFDVVLTTLFLHHLNRNDAKKLLRRMAELSKQIVIVDDLRRTRLGYVFALVGCRILSRSPIVHYDGPLSVKAAFTEPEVLQMAEEAGLLGASTTRHWPQRFLFEWRRA